MKKAVMYMNETGSQELDAKIMDALEAYCEENEYDIVALIGEGSKDGLSKPMMYSFIGMAMVEEIEVVVTISKSMVSTSDEKILSIMKELDCFGVAMETVRGDLGEFQEFIDMGCDGDCESCMESAESLADQVEAFLQSTRN